MSAPDEDRDDERDGVPGTEPRSARRAGSERDREGREGRDSGAVRVTPHGADDADATPEPDDSDDLPDDPDEGDPIDDGPGGDDRSDDRERDAPASDELAAAIRDGSSPRGRTSGDGFPLATELAADNEILAPSEVAEVTQEIRAVAESRGDDSHVVDLAELSPEPPRPPTRAGEPEPLEVDELRDAWPLLDLEERSDGLHILPRDQAEDFFVSLPSVDQAKLLLHWRPGHRRQWMRMLEPDDVADVIQEAPDDTRAGLLALLDAPTRKEVQALLAYEEDEAGGLMNTRYARLRPQMTVDEAISYLRRQARGKLETIYYAYVLAPDQRLLGVVSFRDLLIAPPHQTVPDIMETDVVRVNDEMDQQTVSRIFAEHDLTVVPVVDADGRMKGIVTVDDIVDVVQEEATEDIQKFGGMEALDMPYLQSSRREMLKKRGSWLALLLLGEMLTATALGFFQKEIDRATVLALFIPLIISSGGNSGSQASTLVIRAMALGEVRPADWWRVLRREIITGTALGLFLGIIASIRVGLWGYYWGSYGAHYILITLTVMLSVVGVVLFGSLAGSMLPFLLRKIGADPASASAPFVATLVDVSGLVIYFVAATLILRGTLL